VAWQILPYEPALLLFERRNLKVKHIIMMIDIKMLIESTKAEKEKALVIIDAVKNCSPDDIVMYHQGRLDAFSLIVEKLTLLLNSENENSSKSCDK